jgi:phenylacetate-CoA ligase
MITGTFRNFLWLQRSQRFKRDELAAFQNRKLREIITHAYHKVPFYQRLYKAAGVDIDQVKDVKALVKLPTIDRHLLTKVPLADRTAVDSDLATCVPLITSGSTGTPLVVLEDRFSACYRAALYTRFSWAYGIRPWHKVCLAGPGPTRRNVYNSIEGFSGFLVKRIVKAISLEAGEQEGVRFLMKWKPDALYARSSEFRRLIKYCEEEGRYPSLKLAVGSHETLDSPTRSLIGKHLHADVFDMYGLTEVGTAAWECPTHVGHHFNADALILEFLREGESVEPGEAGELCITNLYKTATPIIRYLTQDVATPLDGECSCGRMLPLLKNIRSRIIERD